MNLFDYITIWVIFGATNYLIQFLKHGNEWKKEGYQIFFVSVLFSTLISGPIGLLIALITSKGKSC